MAIDVTVDTEIDASPEKVAAYAMEPGHDTEWIRGIKKVNLLSPRPYQKGSQVQRIAYFLGRRIDYVLEVIRYEPGKVIVMKSLKGPFEREVRYEFFPETDGTHVENQVKGGPTGWMRIFAPLMAMGVRKNLKRDLAVLKKIMEKT